MPIEFPHWGLGTAFLGELSDAAAGDLIQAALERQVTLFDTAPLYGDGASEKRLGRALAGVPRNQYSLASKVGNYNLPAPGAGAASYSPSEIRRGVETSLDRLGVDHLDILHLHEPSIANPSTTMAKIIEPALKTLFALREEGVVSLVGAGLNDVHIADWVVEGYPIDVLLLAGKYTLLDRSGGAVIAKAKARGLRVILAGIYNSGILATGAVTGATFNYALADAEIVRKVNAIERCCAHWNISLHAVATQFALRAEGVDTVLFGATHASEVDAFVAVATQPIPEGFWAEAAESFMAEPPEATRRMEP